MIHHGMLLIYLTIIIIFNMIRILSMRAAGAKSTAGRAVKCFDPSKTTGSESAWLGYPFGLLFYNEERRLGVQRGLDTLVVPFVTSNYGISIAL